MKRNIVTSFAAAVLALAAPLANAQAPAASSGDASGFVEGKHFQRLSPAQPTSSETGKVEVAEVFMYSCPACFALEPHLAKWRARQPADVSFIRIPASFNALAILHARAFYAAEALGKSAEIDGPFFEEIHRNGNTLGTEAALAEFFARFGVDAETFKNTFNSFAVQTKVKRADELIRRYRVPSTPHIVVAGKYLTNGSMAGSYDGWFSVIDDLIARERNAE